MSVSSDDVKSGNNVYSFEKLCDFEHSGGGYVNAVAFPSAPLAVSYVNAVAFHPSAPLAVSSSNSTNHNICIWNTSVTPWKCHQTLSEHSNNVCDVRFSPDGTKLASAADDTTVKIWQRVESVDGKTLEEQPNWTCVKTISCDGDVSGIGWSHDGSLLAATNYDQNSLIVWNTTTWEELHSISTPYNNGRRVKFSRDDSHIAVSSWDGKCVTIIDTSSWQAVQSLDGHTDTARSVCWLGQDASNVVTVSGDSKVRVWKASPLDNNMLKWKVEHELDACARVQDVSSYCGNPTMNGESVFATAADNGVKIWSVQSSDNSVKCVHELELTDASSIAINPSGDRLMVGTTHGHVHVWNISPSLGPSTAALPASLPDTAPLPTTAEMVSMAEMQSCFICKEDFYVDISEDKLCAVEAAQSEIATRVKHVIDHHHAHHCGCRHDGTPEAKTQCSWQFGGAASADSDTASRVHCFGNDITGSELALDWLAGDIVDTALVNRIVTSRDETTQRSVLHIRSDRMLPTPSDYPQHIHLPVLLHCGHVICRSCAHSCVEPHHNPRHDTLFGIVKCPFRCSRRSIFVADLGVEWLPLDVSRIRMLRDGKPQESQELQEGMKKGRNGTKRGTVHKCSVHKTRKATVYCTQPLCSDFPFMCSECNAQEHSSRNGQKHKRIPVSDTAAINELLTSKNPTQMSSSKCKTHGEPIVAVCYTDNETLCGVCVSNHSKHDTACFRTASRSIMNQAEQLQLESLIGASKASDHAAVVEEEYHQLLDKSTAVFTATIRKLQQKQQQVAFELARWRKMQVEDSKSLASEFSSITAQLLCQRSVLQPALDSASGKFMCVCVCVCARACVCVCVWLGGCGWVGVCVSGWVGVGVRCSDTAICVCVLYLPADIEHCFAH
jgi:WD40 repeat protein